MFTRHPDQACRSLLSDPSRPLRRAHKHRKPAPGDLIGQRFHPDPSCSPACSHATWTGGAGSRGTAPLTLLGYMDTLERFGSFSLATLGAKTIDSYPTDN